MLASSLLTVAALLLCASPTSPLGPKDGRDLPPADLNRIQTGAPAPDFVLEAADGRRIALSDSRGSKKVVLLFYRGQW